MENSEDKKSQEQKDADKERLIRQRNMIVCICKGIPLGKVLPGLEGSESVSDVNKKVGTGCGGCNGQRCGPRIKTLLRKYAERKNKSKNKS